MYLCVAGRLPSAARWLLVVDDRERAHSTLSVRSRPQQRAAVSRQWERLAGTTARRACPPITRPRCHAPPSRVGPSPRQGGTTPPDPVCGAIGFHSPPPPPPSPTARRPLIPSRGAVVFVALCVVALLAWCRVPVCGACVRLGWCGGSSWGARRFALHAASVVGRRVRRGGRVRALVVGVDDWLGTSTGVGVYDGGGSERVQRRQGETAGWRRRRRRREGEEGWEGTGSRDAGPPDWIELAES
ncbi:hypothetical protein BD410DRAFT_810512 [Rickenella mellea]|uniref:Uncharacterized protein n=1 Tax=Rickenella mellea TaxID=50990 RepID=A0A4Y7PDV2_9AGAM|nr:hypothetical protein BD410DRAFT_810512 [Rickenella mellea]